MGTNAGVTHESERVANDSTSTPHGLHNPGVFALPPTSLLPLVGLWTMHVWIFWFNTTSLRDGVPSAWWSSIYIAMTIAMLVLFVVFRRETDRAVDYASLDLAHTTLLVACTVSVVLQSIVGPSLLWDTANKVVGGCCMAWGYLRWSHIYAGFSLRDALACLALSYVVGSFLKIPLEVVDGILGAAMAALIPVCCLLSLRGAKQRTAPVPQPLGEILYSKEGGYQALIRVGVCVFSLLLLARFDLRYGVAASDASTALQSSIITHVVEIILAVLAIVWVFSMERNLDFPMVWRFVYLFFAIAIAAKHLPVFGTGVTNWCNGVGISLTVMLLWLFLTDVSHHIDWHPYAVFGLGWCAYVGASAAVSVLAAFAPAPSDVAVMDVVVVLLMSIAVMFVLGSSSPDVRRILQDLHPLAERSDYEAFDRRCERLGSEYGLTEREIEVFKLLAKGRSKAFIAEELVLSENTIRGHSKHIYTKLGVHTRGELQAMLDE